MVEQYIHIAAREFGLQDLKTITQNKEKAVVSARSPEFGYVVVKLDSDWMQLEQEYRMLEQCGDIFACPVYAFRKVEIPGTGRQKECFGLLLQKRILPGTTLRTVSSMEERIRVFCHLFRNIHREDCVGQEYCRWLENNIQFCQMYHSGTEIEEMAKRAFYICVDMYARYPGCLLLHGDLHHDNILLDSDGQYRIIDPKAVIGPAILDIPRFLLNEVSMAGEDPEGHIHRCIQLISRALGYPEEDLEKLFYMETVLANIWNLEDGLAMDPAQIDLAKRFLA